MNSSNSTNSVETFSWLGFSLETETLVALNIFILAVLLSVIVAMVFFYLRNVRRNRVVAALFDSQEALMITDPNGKIVKVNPSFSKITGYKEEEVLGKTPAVLSSGKQDEKFYQIMWRSLVETGRWRGEICNKRKNGDLYVEWVTISAVKNSLGKTTNFVASFIDITQHKEDERRVRQLAYFDPLTDLPNRRYFIEKLEDAVFDSHIEKRYSAVFFIDLDNFKNLNDTRGHQAGDKLLKEVGKRLLSNVRATDTVARFGGDEFVVLLEKLNAGLDQAVVEAEFIATGMKNALNKPYVFEDFTHLSSPSIGIALFQGKEHSIEDILKKADNAMYQAKGAGRNTIRIFNPEIQKEIEDRIRLQEDLREAILQDELTVYFQPQVNTKQNKITGVETLVRWFHPERGYVSPEVFIPLAEETNLIYELGPWLFEKVCSKLASWQSFPLLKDLSISINVSARQIEHDDFIACVERLLTEYKVPPKLLTLEITESIDVSKIENITQKMSILKSKGAKFSMDDFGTGYSSLAYISQLPLDEVKIDRSFVNSMHSNRTNYELLKAIITMSSALDLNIVAEGVETQDQINLLESMDCYSFQGYYFAEPMPEDKLIDFLKRYSA